MPTENPILSQAEVSRYSRHLMIPEVGLAGQRQLKAAAVLLVGTGGLGSPLALYLAAAGIGRIGVVDDSNLQRQVIHDTSRDAESGISPPANAGAQSSYSGRSLQ